MRGIVIFLSLTVLILLVACRTDSRRTLPTVATVDLERYLGKWYEVARLPTPFQKEDEKAIAEYFPKLDGSIEVRNTAIAPDGEMRTASGTATVVPGSGNARLRVRFSGIASLVPVSKQGNYWILALDPQYKFAMVGTPDRKYLWLLARDPDGTSGVVEGYLARAGKLGFPIEKVLRTEW